MAYGNPDSKPGGDGFFNDDSESESMDEKKPMDKKDDMAETSVLPKSMFGGYDPKVGEEYVFEVKRLFEDTVEIAYAPKKKGDESEHEEGSMDHANEELEGMASEKSTGGY